MPEPDGTTTAAATSLPDEADGALPAGQGSGAEEAVRVAATPARRRRPGGGRMLTDLLRPSRAQLVLAVALCLVAMGTVWQMRARQADETYSSLRRSELVGLLDQLTRGNDDLRQQIADQEEQRRQLQSGADNRRLAQQQADKRIQDLSILAGTAPAQGPGITIVVTDPRGKVTPALLLDAVEEMRDAGAEVMELNGTRIVAQTWFGGEEGAPTVNGTPLTSPYVLKVIGEPHELSEGAGFRGGLVSRAQAPEVGAVVTITTSDAILITSLYRAPDPRWARPA